MMHFFRPSFGAHESLRERRLIWEEWKEVNPPEAERALDSGDAELATVEKYAKRLKEQERAIDTHEMQGLIGEYLADSDGPKIQAEEADKVLGTLKKLAATMPLTPEEQKELAALDLTKQKDIAAALEKAGFITKGMKLFAEKRYEEKKKMRAEQESDLTNVKEPVVEKPTRKHIETVVEHNKNIRKFAIAVLNSDDHDMVEHVKGVTAGIDNLMKEIRKNLRPDEVTKTYARVSSEAWVHALLTNQKFLNYVQGLKRDVSVMINNDPKLHVWEPQLNQLVQVLEPSAFNLSAALHLLNEFNSVAREQERVRQEYVDRNGLARRGAKITKLPSTEEMRESNRQSGDDYNNRDQRTGEYLESRRIPDLQNNDMHRRAAFLRRSSAAADPGYHNEMNRLRATEDYRQDVGEGSNYKPAFAPWNPRKAAYNPYTPYRPNRLPTRTEYYTSSAGNAGSRSVQPESYTGPVERKSFMPPARPERPASRSSHTPEQSKTYNAELQSLRSAGRLNGITNLGKDDQSNIVIAVPAAGGKWELIRIPPQGEPIREIVDMKPTLKEINSLKPQPKLTKETESLRMTPEQREAFLKAVSGWNMLQDFSNFRYKFDAQNNAVVGRNVQDGTGQWEVVVVSPDGKIDRSFTTNPPFSELNTATKKPAEEKKTVQSAESTIRPKMPKPAEGITVGKSDGTESPSYSALRTPDAPNIGKTTSTGPVDMGKMMAPGAYKVPEAPKSARPSLRPNLNKDSYPVSLEKLPKLQYEFTNKVEQFEKRFASKEFNSESQAQRIEEFENALRLSPLFDEVFGPDDTDSRVQAEKIIQGWREKLAAERQNQLDNQPIEPLVTEDQPVEQKGAEKTPEFTTKLDELERELAIKKLIVNPLITDPIRNSDDEKEIKENMQILRKTLTDAQATIDPRLLDRVEAEALQRIENNKPKSVPETESDVRPQPIEPEEARRVGLTPTNPEDEPIEPIHVDEDNEPIEPVHVEEKMEGSESLPAARKWNEEKSHRMIAEIQKMIEKLPDSEKKEDLKAVLDLRVVSSGDGLLFIGYPAEDTKGLTIYRELLKDHPKLIDYETKKDAADLILGKYHHLKAHPDEFLPALKEAIQKIVDESKASPAQPKDAAAEALEKLADSPSGDPAADELNKLAE